MNTELMRKAVESDEVQALVRAYLTARAYSETMRKHVDVIHNQIMLEVEVIGSDGERITKVGDLYLTDDDALCNKIYSLANTRLRAAGLKPADMSDDYCPALVAERNLTKAEQAVVNALSKTTDVTVQKLLCAGMAEYRKYIDLIVGAVVNSPKFKKAVKNEQ